MRKMITILSVLTVVIALSCGSVFAGDNEYLLDLKKGRNFVSLPLSITATPVSGTILNLFGSALSKFDSIEYFDTANGKWLIHDAASWGDQELERLPDGAAFFVNAKEDVKVTVYGTRAEFFAPVLVAGWNAIGVAQPVTVSKFAERVATFHPDYDRIYQYDSKGIPVALKMTDIMSPGTGYWLDNDPDGDGVMSSVEIAVSRTSPLVRDSGVAGTDQSVAKGEQLESADAGKIDYLRKECSLVYYAAMSESLDELHARCRNLVNTYGEYTVVGSDVVLGGDENDTDANRRKTGFTVSSVRYKHGEDGRKIAGVGVIRPEGIPEDLKYLFRLHDTETVFLDLKDEQVVRAVGETLNGFTIGGTAGLTMTSGANGTKFDTMVIEKDGSLEINLTATLDAIPERNYFVRWSPDDRYKLVNKKGFIQLGLLLGDEEEPGDELTASRVWYAKNGAAEPLRSGGHVWLLNLPLSAKGVFDPYVTAGDKETMISNTFSPAVNNDFSMFSWLPATPAVSGDELSFTGPASKVRFMSELIPENSMLGVTSKDVTVDGKGIITVEDTTFRYRFEKGAFVLGYPAIGLDLYFEGWKRVPDKSGALKTGLVTSWKPSFKVYLGYQSDDLLKEVSVAVPLSVQYGGDIIRTGATDFDRANVKPRLLGFGWGLDGKLLFNFDGYEVGVTAGIERKEEELYKSGDDVKKLITTLISVQFPSLKSTDVDVIFNSRVREQYLTHEGAQSSGGSSPPSANDREGYRSHIELTGEGRYRLAADIPLVGGNDLTAAYRGELQFKGMDSAGKRTYLAKTQVSLGLSEAAGNIREEDGWRFSLDELRLELEEVEISGADSQLEVIGKYLKPSAPKGVKRFTGFVTLNPPEDFVHAGPFEGSLIAERLSAVTDAGQKWRVSINADIDARLPLDGDDNYLLLRQLAGVKETGQNWNFGAVAEMHLGERVIAGNLFLQRGGVYTFVVNGYDLDDTFKGLDLMVYFTKGSDGKWQWTASLGGKVSGKAVAALLGQDGSRVSADLMINGTLSSSKLVVTVDNVPFNWGGLPDWIILEKIRNITYTREKMSNGTSESSFAFDVDVMFTHFADPQQPREQWPRFTMGAVYSPKGLQVSGRNLGPIDIRDGAQLTILEAAVGFGKDDPEANKAVKVIGSVKITLPDSWLEGAAPYTILPREMRASFEYSKDGFRTAQAFDKPTVVGCGGGSNLTLTGMEFRKASPWKAGLAGTLSMGGNDYKGLVELGKNPRFVLDDSSSVLIDLTGGYKVRVSKLGIDLGPGFALSGDVVITMPEGNVMNGVVGNSFAAKVSGSTEKYSFSTETNVSSTMDMGLLGTASFTITSISLSTDGSFAGSGTMTIAGQTTSFVIGTRADGLYFMADFGATGIDLKLANLFMLKVKHKIGLESAGPYQYVRIDDMKTSLGTALAGAELATDKFLYFLPASVPPVGVAFFDNLEGRVSIAGFAVGLGMSFPAPDIKDLGTVMGVLGTAFTGGTVNVNSLNKLGAPAFSLRDVALNFPKVPGYVWKDLKLQRTDNLFAAIFGSDRLDIVKSASLQPKDFVELITANSPMDVIKVAVPADKRKGSMNIDLRGFKTAVSYDLRSDELIYEKREVKKLPGMYTFISKLLYVDKNNGGLPAELKGSGGTASAATAITGDYTELKVKHSGKSMDITGMSTENGANVRQWVSRAGENQQWKLNPDGGDYYQIEAKISGKCLDVAGYGTKNGANVQQWDCNGADNQKWKLISHGNDYYQLQAKHSGRCLDVAGAGTQDGANIRQWDCGSGDNQKWLIPRGTGGSRSKTVDVSMPKEQGGGKAQLTWRVEDITADLKAIKEIVSAITPDQNTKWEDHLTVVWNQFAQKGLTFNGNRASFRYSPTVTAELELTEYDDSLDITGIKYVNNELFARFGTTTLYAEKNFEGKSWTITDDVSEDAMRSSAIGTRNLSSVKIEGRGKVVLNSFYRIFTTTVPLVSELTGSLDTLDDSKVSDNQATSAKVFYPISTGKVTGWRLVFKSDKGIVTTVDAGGIEVIFPEGSRALSLLPNGRLFKAVGDTRKVLEDLKPYPRINSDPTGFITSVWNNRMLSRKDYYIDSTVDDDVEENEKPVEFRRSDNSIIGFIPLKYDGDRKVAGLKFDQKQGTLNGKIGKVTLYEHANYEGKNLVVDEDIPDLGETTFGNDTASSIKVEEGAVATLYSDRQYRERWYYDYTTVKAQHSGKCLDVSGNSRQSGANIHQWDCNGGDNQLWKLVPNDGWYSLVAKHSGKCADVYWASSSNGANVLQWDCHGGHNQEWKLTSLGGNAYSLRNHHSGKCLDVSGAGTHAGANVQQWGCVDVGQQTWLMNLNKGGFLTTSFDKETGWLGGYTIGNDSVRSVKVYNPLDIGKVKEWKLLQSTPTGGNVVLANVKGTDGQYKPVISTDLRGTGHTIQSYYDDNGKLSVTAYAASGAKFPADNFRVYVKGTPHDLTDITEASQYVRIITKSVKLPDGATAVLNEDGGITAQHADVAIAPAEDAPSVSVFLLPGPDGMNLRFNITRAAGFGAAQIVGSKPVEYAPVYADDSGVPRGIKKVVGKVEGGFFMDAGLNVGTAATAQVNLHVSGAIKTDGNYYLKGNGNLIIANLEVSEAVIELSSEKGLIIKGKMDLYGAKVDITGYLTPDNKFSFTGTAQVMVAGNGIKGALAIDYAGKDVSTAINGSVYLANKKIVSGTFAIKDGEVSWPTKVSIGFAGFDSTVAVALKQGAASYTGKAYINVDIPIYVWGPKGWKCKRYWGVKVCWPRSWGNIRVGTLGIHHSTAVKGSISGSSVGIKLGIATLSVDVSKPSLKASW